jgi:putative RecB family exonuclease
MVDYRSHSQVNQYRKCPRAYELQRIDKVWQIPAAWLPMGTAVHAAAEAWEKSNRTQPREETIQVFKDSYDAETNLLMDITPNLNYWFASGPYEAEEDIARRFDIGMEHVDTYVSYYQARPEEKMLRIEDEPLIELSFEFDLDGIPVRGFIDGVIDHPTLGAFPRDIKTGRMPGDPMQLALYGISLDTLGYPSSGGDFFMTRTGKATPPVLFTNESRQVLTAEYHSVDESIKAGDFPAKPSRSNCRVCPVQHSCAESMA